MPSRDIIDGAAIGAAVAADGLPRVATATDGTQHVLYLEESGRVRSMDADAWDGPLPTDPTPAEIDAAIAARETERATRIADALALRQQIRTTARALAGRKPAQWGVPELRGLVALLLHEGGYLEADAALKDVED